MKKDQDRSSFCHQSKNSIVLLQTQMTIKRGWRTGPEGGWWSSLYGERPSREDGWSLSKSCTSRPICVCGPAVGWTKSGIRGGRALNGARHCMLLCAGKWFTQWTLHFFLAPCPLMEQWVWNHREVSWPYWLCFLGKMGLSFPMQLPANREISEAKAKTCQQKSHDS